MQTISSNKGLILSANELDGYNYVDMGHLLAEFLKDKDLESVSLPMIAYDAVKDILKENVSQSPTGINYIAIKNFNILFEPSLKMKVGKIIEESSRDILTILLLNQPVDQKKKRYYPFPDDPGYSLDFNDLSVTIQMK